MGVGDTDGQESGGTLPLRSADESQRTTLNRKNGTEDSEEKENSKQHLVAADKGRSLDRAKPKNSVHCRVIMLDGTELSLDIEKACKAELLVDRICEHLNLREKEYFSVTYQEHGDRFWLNHEKKISDQIRNGPWRFLFEVKFYPPSPSQLLDDVTRYLLCLQVRADILAEKVPCSFVTYSLLGSYAVQSDIGDYEHDEHGSGINYLRGIHIAPHQSEELMEKVAELHRTHRGLTPSACEYQYLENAKNLAMYGVHGHPAKDKEGVEIMVGVQASGLVIYKDRLRISRYPWARILKISYKRNNFYIKARPEEDKPKSSESKVGFKCPNHKKAKRLWKLAVEHHAFFRLKQSDPPKRSAFPPFGPKFRYSGRTQYQTRLGPGLIGSGNSTLDRPTSRQSLPANLSKPTTPVGTYRPDQYPGGSLNPKKGGPGGGGSVPFAELDDDLGEAGDRDAAVRPRADNVNYAQPPIKSYDRLPAVKGSPYTSHATPISPSNTGGTGAGLQVDNVKPVIQEPERAQIVADKDHKMHFIRRPLNESAAPNYIDGHVSPGGKPPGGVGGYNSTPAGAGGYPHYKHGPAGQENPSLPRDYNQPRSSSPAAGTDPHGNVIITKNVYITATLDPNKSSAGGNKLPEGEDYLPPYQEDHLNQSRLSGRGLNNEGCWTAGTASGAGPTSVRTYTAPDGTIITEYKTEKDGMVETRIEKRLVVRGDETVDHDKALAEAIRSVTDMNPDLSVQKIEIQTKTDDK